MARDRSARLYVGHRRQVRYHENRTVRLDPATEARIQADLDSYTPPNWHEMVSKVLAFCPDSVVTAFNAASSAAREEVSAKGAHAEAVEMNQLDPANADPAQVKELREQLKSAIEKANQLDEELIDHVRDQTLGTGHPKLCAAVSSAWWSTSWALASRSADREGPRLRVLCTPATRSSRAPHFAATPARRPAEIRPCRGIYQNGSADVYLYA